MRLTWLADVLRGVGLQVIEVDGWKGRGHELTTINGIVAHDTVTGTNWSDESVAHLLRDGRPDLAGPLAQLGLDRTGRYWLIADGKCNHNGYGEWGNQAIGIEAFNDAHEAWPIEQLNAWYRGCAAICAHLHLNEGHVLGHKETDPKRKVDPSNLDMDLFRRNVAALLHPPTHPEADVFEPFVVQIPPPNDKGTQIQGHDVNGHELGTFSNDVTVSIKANNDSTPVRCQVQPYGFAGKLALSFFREDGKPATEGQVLVIVGHPAR